MFSSRTPSDLGSNRLTRALEARRAEGGSILDLTESNPTQAGFDYPGDLLLPLADPRALIYTPSPFGLADTRAAVAADYSRRGVNLSPERIALTASTSEAYGCLLKLLTSAGDEVLVPTPSYPLLDHLARLDQVTPQPYVLDPNRGWAIDFDSLEDGLTPRTRAILVVSPNNPTGSFLKAGEADRLAEIAAARRLALVADEVFYDYNIASDACAARVGVSGRDDVLSFSLGGLSKSVGLPQVKLAWVAAAGPAALVAAALERLELICDTYLSVSTPVQVAAPRFLERGAVVRQQIARRISANYRLLCQALGKASGCRLHPAEGGWYGVIEIPAAVSDEQFVLDLLARDGVLVHPGYFFDFPTESYLVVSLIVAEARFAEGIERLLRCLECTVASRG
jgi:aspartate/methionine/tyrosine aminotransferase